MSEKDIELEFLKFKKMTAMKKLTQTIKEHDVKKDYRAILLSKLTERAKEILSYAEAQYPKETEMIIKVLSNAIESGKISGYIDEYSLYHLFINLGLNVKIPIRIYYASKGEKKPLIELFKNTE
ncbi:MAG: hypothetical protein N3E39_04075 [Candidatus Methanomethylicia archaeon]|nr:hypothetical protein [Candidatus Methanomethylicia archaeon]